MTPTTEFSRTVAQWAEIMEVIPEDNEGFQLWEKIDGECEGHRMDDTLTIALTSDQATLAGLT